MCQRVAGVQPLNHDRHQHRRQFAGQLRLKRLQALPADFALHGVKPHQTGIDDLGQQCRRILRRLHQPGFRQGANHL